MGEIGGSEDQNRQSSRELKKQWKERVASHSLDEKSRAVGASIRAIESNEKAGTFFNFLTDIGYSWFYTRGMAVVGAAEVLYEECGLADPLKILALKGDCRINDPDILGAHNMDLIWQINNQLPLLYKENNRPVPINADGTPAGLISYSESPHVVQSSLWGYFNFSGWGHNKERKTDRVDIVVDSGIKLKGGGHRILTSIDVAGMAGDLTYVLVSRNSGRRHIVGPGISEIYRAEFLASNSPVAKRRYEANLKMWQALPSLVEQGRLSYSEKTHVFETL